MKSDEILGALALLQGDPLNVVGGCPAVLSDGTLFVGPQVFQCSDFAVPMKLFVGAVKKMKQEFDVLVDDKEVVLQSKTVSTGIRTSSLTLALPNLGTVQWNVLDDQMKARMAMAAATVAGDFQYSTLCCLHFGPDYIESCNNVQGYRGKLDMPGMDGCLVDARSFPKSLEQFDSWFRNEDWFVLHGSDGLSVYLRMVEAEYPKFDRMYDESNGNPITIPAHFEKTLVEHMSFATMFSSNVMVTMDGSVAKMEGRGVDGWVEVKRKLKDPVKPALRFSAAGKILEDIVQRCENLIVFDNRIMASVNDEKFVAVLS